MFTLDAELRSERWNLNDQKTKSEIKKQLEVSIAEFIHKFEEIIKNLKKSHSMTSLPPSKSCKCYLMNASIS